jgi:serine protease AprX
MEWNKRTVLPLTLVFLSFLAQAQERLYFISFKQKDTTLSPTQFLSKKSLQRRSKQHIKIHPSDYPVAEQYLCQISNIAGIQVLITSKWLNGVLVSAKSPITSSHLAFVDKTTPIIDLPSNKDQGLMSAQKQEAIDYGNSQYQVASLGADIMHLQGYDGAGIHIAIFDGGFLNANTSDWLSPIYNTGRLKFTYNVVDNKSDVYVRHLHGTNVMSCLAAYSPGNLIGTGFGADFSLFLTEVVESETRIEEYYWLKAAEMADSIGADIISSSLGYYSFDDASENHSFSELDGKTSIITKAAQMASNKGILVVTSAGNNYNDSNWRNIVFPADGDSILAVGAVDSKGIKASYSAIGPSFDGRIKPDVSAFGTGVVINKNGGLGSGTSYSAPLVAGLAAGLWQMDTTLSNMELKEAIVQSSSQYSNPDNLIGYGIPNFTKACEIIRQKSNGTCSVLSIRSESIPVFPNPVFDIFTFESTESLPIGTAYFIVDLSGKEIEKGKTVSDNPKIKIDISTLRTGVYFLKVGNKLYRLVKI